MAEDLNNVIRESASGPAKASADGTTVEQHKLTDVIAAQKHLGAQQALNSRGLGLRRVKIVPPGTV